MKLALSAGLLCLLLLLPTSTIAEVAVIVHPSNSSELDEKSIARIFTGKLKSFPNGSPIIPISLTSGQAATKEFNEKVLKRTDSQLKAYWSKLVFTGKGSPPTSMDNATQLLQAISTNPSAIGFIDASEVTDAVRVVAKF